MNQTINAIELCSKALQECSQTYYLSGQHKYWAQNSEKYSLGFFLMVAPTSSPHKVKERSEHIEKYVYGSANVCVSVW